jgi:aryl-alcohol dehydrogenase-like predicted oxidoreductase
MDRARIDLSEGDHGGRPSAQTAMGYVLGHPAVRSVVLGVSSVDQLVEGVGTVDGAEMDDEEISRLKALLPAKVYAQHR